jgi:putative DNA primase/helicase
VSAPPFDPLPLLTDSGVSGLTGFSSVDTVAAKLRAYVGKLNGADPLDTAAAQAMALREVKAHDVRNGRELVLAAFKARAASVSSTTTSMQGVVTMRDPDPASVAQNGAALLTALAEWVTGYLYLSRYAVDAVALWIAATWYVGVTDFAPLLALISATKRCGKTLLLHLISLTSRRGYGTSGAGVTTAVLFRLNERFTPTLCIDEAEKLSGRDADRELIGMLNAGYRRGARVQRCVEKNGDYEIREFDAFGFRALASIKGLWDTVMDRAVVIQLERKPAGAAVRRFAGRVADAEAVPFTQRLARWATDVQPQIGEALLSVPRPDWLHDRACDNWAVLFAVAEVAGGDWPDRAREAARTLEAASQAVDPTEQLVHDVARTWKAEGWTEAVASGDLVEKLNASETSPWGSWGKTGKGLTTHTLASMFKVLKVRPRLGRSDRGVVRGYWLVDLEPVFERYPLPIPLELLQVSQPLHASPDADSLVTPVTRVTVGAESGGPVRGDAWEPEP